MHPGQPRHPQLLGQVRVAHAEPAWPVEVAEGAQKDGMPACKNLSQGNVKELTLTEKLCLKKHSENTKANLMPLICLFSNLAPPVS